MDVENKVRVFDNVHPKSKRNTAVIEYRDVLHKKYVLAMKALPDQLDVEMYLITTCKLNEKVNTKKINGEQNRKKILPCGESNPGRGGESAES